jgi:hypothetical protein
MSVETWDVDQAVTRGPLDEDLEGCCAFERYGVTGREEVRGEPFVVALAQEEADIAPFTGPDDQWVFVDVEDFGALDRAALDGGGPETGAMHLAMTS